MKVQKIKLEETELKIVGVSLPTIDRVSQLPDRIRKYRGPWWLQDKGSRSFNSVVVLSNGKYLRVGANVDHNGIYVRPLLRLQTIKDSVFEVGDLFFFGDKIFEIVSNGLAFCKEDLGKKPFRSEWKSEDANEYDVSDVKKHIENWYEKAINSNVNKV